MVSSVVTDVFGGHVNLLRLSSTSAPQVDPAREQRPPLQYDAEGTHHADLAAQCAAAFEKQEALHSSLSKIFEFLSEVRQRQVPMSSQDKLQHPFSVPSDAHLDSDLENFVSRISIITAFVGSQLVHVGSQTSMKLRYPWDASGVLYSLAQPIHEDELADYTQALDILLTDVDNLGLTGLPGQKASAIAGNYLLKSATESLFNCFPESEDQDLSVPAGDLTASNYLQASVAEIIRFADRCGHKTPSASHRTYEDWCAVADLKVIEQNTKLLYDLTMQNGFIRNVLRDHIKTPMYRLKFSAKLTTELKKRIRPDTPTVEVLEEFLSLLSVVRLVDPTGVVLQSPMRYVRDNLQKRGDAVQIIATSMLEPFDSTRQSGGLYCAPIAEAIHSLSIKPYQIYYEGSDLTDPEWLPDPIDAQKGYRQGVYMDQVTHLLDLQPQEQFAEILQGVMGKNLIASEGYKFEMELRLLATLKPRMNEELVKRFEVMIQDALKSRDTDSSISQSIIKLHAPLPDIRAKVLSYRFWPDYHDLEFSPPSVVQDTIKIYGESYRKLKEGRRLEWFSGAGSVDIELVIGDDCISERVTPLQSAVIALFGDNDPVSAVESEDSANVSLSYIIQVLSPRGQSNKIRIKEAIEFWVNKGVLKQVDSDVWITNERLMDDAAGDSMTLSHNQDTGFETQQQPQLQTALDAILANEEVYANFVTHMLRNQGAMAAARVLQFMKMLLPGGFPFQEQDLLEFLNILQQRGTIERNGANWRIPQSR